MKEFQVKHFSASPRRPSLNSVIAHKKRQRLVAAGHSVSEGDPLEARNETYTEREEKIMAEAGAMSLVGHLTELRSRLLVSFVAVLIGCGIAYYFMETILSVLTAPAGTLYYTRPTEAFFTYMKIAFVGGIVLASPVWLYEVWAFVIPALSKEEKKVTSLVLPIAIILFLVGVLFSYFFVLPAAIAFFIGFATDELQPLLSIGQYIDFVIAFILPFGFIFELPLVLVVLGMWGLITADMLESKRKLFILIAFIVGAAISPTPDMFSQTMIALPMVLLYEMSIRILRIFVKP